MTFRSWWDSLTVSQKLIMYNVSLRLKHLALNFQQLVHGEQLTPWRGSAPRPRKAGDR